MCQLSAILMETGPRWCTTTYKHMLELLWFMNFEQMFTQKFITESYE